MKLEVLSIKYSHMFFAVMMLINNKLKPVPKTNALRTDCGGLALITFTSLITSIFNML